MALQQNKLTDRPEQSLEKNKVKLQLQICSVVYVRMSIYRIGPLLQMFLFTVTFSCFTLPRLLVLKLY